MTLKEALFLITQRKDLSKSEMSQATRFMLSSDCTDGQIGAFLSALRLKGESIEEIVGAATVLRDMVQTVPIRGDYVIDIVGTGGDHAHLFNVSTASAFVAASAGASVAKHGNRGVSSSSGSADLLETQGVDLNMPTEKIVQCVNEVGVGFMFAPAHHLTTKRVAKVRRELGIRTIFNILGPLTNPAKVKKMLTGVFDSALCMPLAEAFKALGDEHVLVVNSQDGLDEISLASPTKVVELKNNQLTEFTIQPEDFGLSTQTIDDLTVKNAQESFDLIRDALSQSKTKRGQKAADMIALNAGAAIYIASRADSLVEGVQIAKSVLTSDKALNKLYEYITFAQ